MICILFSLCFIDSICSVDCTFSTLSEYVYDVYVSIICICIPQHITGDKVSWIWEGSSYCIESQHIPTTPVVTQRLWPPHRHLSPLRETVGQRFFAGEARCSSLGDLKAKIALCRTRNSTFFFRGKFCWITWILETLFWKLLIIQEVSDTHPWIGSKSWQMLCWYVFGARIVNSTFAYTTWYHSILLKSVILSSASTAELFRTAQGCQETPWIVTAQR